MNAATRHVETDALAALRAELLSAAGRNRSRRRRNRRLLVAVAIIVGLLAATAATATIADFSTGVAAVDELLAIERSPGTLGGVPRLDIRPGPGPASEPLSVPIGDDIYKTVAYLSRDRSICISSANRDRGRVRGSSGGCLTIGMVNRAVKRKGGIWSGGSRGTDQRTTEMLVGARVESARPLGRGDWTVLMTPPWSPRAPGARPLRLMVVIDGADLPEEEILRAPLGPGVRLTYRDGHTRVLRGP
jgi:hypothetical protein